MGIVLREAAHAGQTVQLTALLVAIDGAELGQAQGQVFVGTRLPGIDGAVVRAVHRFEEILFTFFGSGDGLERVFAVFGIVAGGDVEVL